MANCIVRISVRAFFIPFLVPVFLLLIGNQTNGQRLGTPGIKSLSKPPEKNSIPGRAINTVYPFEKILADPCSINNTFQITYTQGTDDYVNDLVQTTDGGFIVTGESTGGNSIGTRDGFILKVDSKGLPLWNKKIGGSSADVFTRIKNTSDGGFIVTGYTSSFGHSAGDIFLVKLTATGLVTWATTFGNAEYYGVKAYDVIQTADGYALTGNYNSSNDSSNIVVIKTNSNGNLLWAKKFISEKLARATGIVSAGADLYISGYTTKSYLNNFDGIIIKINSATGTHTWTKSYDKNGLSDRILSIHNGINSLLLPFSHSVDNYNYGNHNSYTRIDMDGNVIDSKKINVGESNNVENFLSTTSDGGIVATMGYSNNYNPDAKIVRFDAAGNVIFSRKFPKPGWQLMAAVLQLSDGSYAIAGRHAETLNFQGKAELIKTDVNGNTAECDTDTLNVSTSDQLLQVSSYTWNAIQNVSFSSPPFVSPLVKEDIIVSNQFCRSLPCDSIAMNTCYESFEKLYGGNGNDIAVDIHTTTDQGYIVTGKTTSYSAGAEDGFLMKLNKTGTIQWSKTIGGKEKDIFSRVVQTTDGFIAIGTTSSFGNLKGETFVVKTDRNGNVIWSKHFSTSSGNGEKGKDIIQLSNGGFAFITNINDSTVSGDGLIVCLDAAGNIIWNQKFDNGKDDGFHQLIQDEDTLIVAGYSYFTDREAVLLKIKLQDGSHISSKKYFHFAGMQDEMMHVEKIPGGLAYSFHTWNYDGRYYFNDLSYFKETGGSIFYQRKSQFGQGFKIQKVASVSSSDSGYVYIFSDTTAVGFSQLEKVGPTGMHEWGRANYEYGTFLLSLDRIGDKGFVMAGTRLAYSTENKNKIAIYTTDFVGRTADCGPMMDLDFVDTANYNIGAMQWYSIISSPLPVNGDISPVIINSNFATNAICAKTICDSIPIISDSCSTGTFITYRSLYRNFLTDISPTSDNGYVMTGTHFYYSSAEPLVIKTKSNGDIQWAKTYNEFIRSGSLTKVVTTSDNKIIVAGTKNYTINHGSSDYSILIKLDQAGNVIWAKYFTTSYSNSINDIIPSNDGGFFVVMTRAYGMGPIYTDVLKIDGNGNIIFKKEVVCPNSGPIFRTIHFDGQNLYIASNDYTSNGLLMTVKLDASTGNYIWSKNLKLNTGDAVVRSVQTIADTVFVFYIVSNQLSMFNYDYNLGMIKMQASTGNIISSVKLTNPKLSYSAFSTVYNYHLGQELVKTKDNNFVLANQAIQGPDTTLNMVCFNSAGVVQWQKNYPNIKKTGIFSLRETGNNLIMVSNNKVYDSDYPYGSTGGFIKTDLLGNIKPLANSATTCFSTLISSNLPSPLPYTEYPTRIEAVITDTILFTSNYTPYIRNIYFKAEQSCSELSECTKFQITGLDTVCKFSDTLTYAVTRNPGCTSAAFWTVDTSHIRIVASTDTTLKITVYKTGNSRITASINSGCSVLSNVFPLTIMASPDSIKLGPDRSICGSDTIMLNAHSGFKSYLWQDGSTDSTKIITKPGIYYVTVESYCHGFFSDTVIVRSSVPLPLFIGKDTSICRNDTITLTANPGFNSYTWTPSYNINKLLGSSVKVWPATDTMYAVAASDVNGCIVRDSISVSVFKTSRINLGADTSICSGSRLILNAGNGFIKYQWNTGSTSSQISITDVGEYYVNAIDINGCASRDTISILKVFIPPVIHLGNDTSICSGNTLTLNAGTHFISYTWNTGQTTSQVQVKNPGIYFVDAIDSNRCHSFDTLQIISLMPAIPINLGNDTTLCQGNTITLNAGTGFTNYSWSTGETSQQITVSSPGIYTVVGTNPNLCRSIDTFTIIRINASPQISLNKDNFLCEGSVKVLDAGPGLTYLWQDGSTSQTFTATGIGKYWVQVKNSAMCTASDTSEIKQLITVPRNFVVKDTSVCGPPGIVLRSVSQFTKYLWSTGSSGSQITVLTPGTYWLQVTNSYGCIAKEYINVLSGNCAVSISIPNAFTPNNDGLNDIFRVSTSGTIKRFSLKVYNRFGEKVFETTDPSKGWDGKYKYVTQDPDVFVWYLEYEFLNEPARLQHGTVTLLR